MLALRQRNPVTSTNRSRRLPGEGYEATESVNVRAKLYGNNVKTEVGILPRDAGLAVITLESRAYRYLVKKLEVLFISPRGIVGGRLREICPQRSFSPCLRARPLNWQALVSAVQVVDHVIVVIGLVVVEVIVLKGCWSVKQNLDLYKMLLNSYGLMFCISRKTIFLAVDR